jgi:hypothetical protein
VYGAWCPAGRVAVSSFGLTWGFEVGPVGIVSLNPRSHEEISMPQLRGKRGAPSSAADDAAREDLFRRKLARKHGDDSPGTPSRTPTAQSEAEAPSTPQKSQTKGKTESTRMGSDSGIWVNRAPVLTLWVAKVAERQGFSREAGLSFGKRIAGKNSLVTAFWLPDPGCTVLRFAVATIASEVVGTRSGCETNTTAGTIHGSTHFAGF